MIVERLQKVVAALRKRAAQARREERASVVVGYSTNYAVHVHENLEVHHNVGQAKYLEEPARTKEKDIRDVVVRSAQGGATLTQALVLGGLTLQRESQKLVPVDTGALRNSAFTRVEGS